MLSENLLWQTDFGFGRCAVTLDDTQTIFLMGLGVIDEPMLILLDIDSRMSSGEISLVEKLAA